jgi:hypothetical protein
VENPELKSDPTKMKIPTTFISHLPTALTSDGRLTSDRPTLSPASSTPSRSPASPVASAWKSPALPPRGQPATPPGGIPLPSRVLTFPRPTYHHHRPARLPPSPLARVTRYLPLPWPPPTRITRSPPCPMRLFPAAMEDPRAALAPHAAPPLLALRCLVWNGSRWRRPATK